MSKIICGFLPILLLVSAHTTIADDNSCMHHPEGLVSCWDGDAIIGNIVLDEIGDNDGLLQGLAQTVPALGGDGFSLGGPSDQIVLPTIAGFPLGNSPRTISAWVQTDAGYTYYNPVFDYGNNAQDELFSLILSPSAHGGKCNPGEVGRLIVATWLDDPCSVSAVSPGIWTHIAVVYDGGTSIDYYLNGKYDSTGTLDSVLDTRHNGRIQAIGGRDNFVWYRGLLDSIAIFDKALSATEIKSACLVDGLGICDTAPTIGLLNGDFEDGLNGWSTLIDSGGRTWHRDKPPQIGTFNVDGQNGSSKAVMMKVGRVSGSGSRGGSIYQDFYLTAGRYRVTADIAGAKDGVNAQDSGRFTLRFANQKLDYKETGWVGKSGGPTVQRKQLSGEIDISTDGIYQLKITVRRPYTWRANHPRQWIDDVEFEMLPNDMPVADAGEDQSVSVGQPVQLDASGSTDPDGDRISMHWSSDGIVFDDETSSNPTAQFPVGDTLVTLTVDDGHGGLAYDRVNVTVVANRPPVADAGDNKTIEANITNGAHVTLDGGRSSDPDGDSLDYAWSAPGVVFDNQNASTPTGTFPLGTTTATLTVNDGRGGEASDTVQILVRDTQPPVLSVAATPHVLWPPNHELTDIVVSLNVSDIADPNPEVTLLSITSSELANGTGDGNSEPDIVGASYGLYDTAFQLRAERSGKVNDRTYTITYEASDFSNNMIIKTITILAPHDLGKGQN